jgi:hypothetical protein
VLERLNYPLELVAQKQMTIVEYDEAIYDLLPVREGISINQLAKTAHKSAEGVKEALGRLHDAGRITLIKAKNSQSLGLWSKNPSSSANKSK